MACNRSLIRFMVVGVGAFMLVTFVLGLGVLSAGEQRKIYWSQLGTRTIQRANLDGSNVEDIITLDGFNPNGIALDQGAGKIYWSRSFFGRGSGIQRANLDGSQVEDVVLLEELGVAGIALDPVDGKVYWVDRRLGQIERVDIDGSSRERIVTAEKGADIALDLSSRKMYWSSRALQTIHRANLDGTGVVNLVRVGVSPDRIALAGR